MIIADRAREEPKCVITGQEPGGEATGEGGKPNYRDKEKSTTGILFGDERVRLQSILAA